MMLELLARAAFMHHADQGRDALMHHAVLIRVCWHTYHSLHPVVNITLCHCHGVIPNNHNVLGPCRWDMDGIWRYSSTAAFFPLLSLNPLMHHDIHRHDAQMQLQTCIIPTLWGPCTPTRIGMMHKCRLGELLNRHSKLKHHAVFTGLMLCVLLRGTREHDPHTPPSTPAV